MKNIWESVRSWFASVAKKAEKPIAMGTVVVRAYRAKQQYRKAQNAVTKRSWWARVTRKPYTREELLALDNFFGSSNVAHTAFWENLTGRKVLTHEDEQECRTWHMARYDAITALLHKQYALKEEITVRMYNETMTCALTVAVPTCVVEEEIKKAA